MATHMASSRRKALVHWLVSGWYVYLTTIALILLMALIVVPRTERFVAYWYGTSNPVPNAATLAQERRQDWTHEAWLNLVAAPVGFLLFVHLFGLVSVFRRADDDSDVADLPVGLTGVNLEKKTADVGEGAPVSSTMAVERTVILGANPDASSDSERTQIRSAVSLENEGARFIGANGRYRVERILGSGGMGSVFLGFAYYRHQSVRPCHPTYWQYCLSVGLHCSGSIPWHQHCPADG